MSSFSITPGDPSRSPYLPPEELSIRPVHGSQKKLTVKDLSEPIASPEIEISSLEKMDLIKLTEEQEKALLEIELMTETIESTDSFLELLSITQESAESLTENAETVLSLLENLLDFTQKNKNVIENHQALKDIAVVVKFGLRLFLTAAKTKQDQVSRKYLREGIEILKGQMPPDEFSTEGLRSLTKARKKLEKLEKHLSSQTIESVSNMSLGLPNVLSSTYTVLKWLDYLKDIPFLAFGVNTAASLASIVSTGLEMKGTIQEASLQEKYALSLRPAYVDKSRLKNLLAKRNKVFQSKLAKEKASFTPAFLKLLEKEAVKIQNFNTEPTEEEADARSLLAKEGTDLSKLPGTKNIKTVGDLRTKLETDSEFKNAFLKQQATYRINHKDALNHMAKHGLRLLLEANQEVPKKFFFWKKIKSSINFSYSILAAAISISLGVLVLIGITVPLLPLVLPSLAGVALGAALAVSGLLYLHRYKPNLLKELLQGVKIQLFFNNIPRVFYAFRLKANRLELTRNQIALNFLEAHPKTLEGLKAFRNANEADIPLSLLPLYKELKEKNNESENLEKLKKAHMAILGETDKLHAIVKDQKEKLGYFEKKIQNLQNRLEKAREKDFERNTPYKIEDLESIGKAFIDGEFWLDKESTSLVKKHLGVDITYANHSLNAERKARLKTKLIQQMHRIIQQNSNDFLDWLKTRGI